MRTTITPATTMAIITMRTTTTMTMIIITRMTMTTTIIMAMPIRTIMIMRTTHQPGVTRTRRSHEELTGKHWLRRGLAAIIAVGLRPCSGAIIVLVFALAQGLFWIGVASTFAWAWARRSPSRPSPHWRSEREGSPIDLPRQGPAPGMLLLRGLETAAALVIVFFGAALLTGYIVSERLMGV